MKTEAFLKNKAPSFFPSSLNSNLVLFSFSASLIIHILKTKVKVDFIVPKGNYFCAEVIGNTVSTWQLEIYKPYELKSIQRTKEIHTVALCRQRCAFSCNDVINYAERRETALTL